MQLPYVLLAALAAPSLCTQRHLRSRILGNNDTELALQAADKSVSIDSLVIGSLHDDTFELADDRAASVAAEVDAESNDDHAQAEAMVANADDGGDASDASVVAQDIHVAELSTAATTTTTTPVAVASTITTTVPTTTTTTTTITTVAVVAAPTTTTTTEPVVKVVNDQLVQDLAKLKADSDGKFSVKTRVEDFAKLKADAERELAVLHNLLKPVESLQAKLQALPAQAAVHAEAATSVQRLGSEPVPTAAAAAQEPFHIPPTRPGEPVQSFGEPVPKEDEHFHEKLTRPLMNAINVMRAEFCLRRPDLMSHPKCITFLMDRCAKENSGYGYCHNFEDLLRKQCQDGDTNVAGASACDRHNSLCAARDDCEPIQEVTPPPAQAAPPQPVTTEAPTTAAPTTAAPTTAAPTTAAPTTAAPTTAAPTPAPTTAPTTAVPTIAVPDVAVPTVEVPIIAATTEPPTTKPPTTKAPTTQPPATTGTTTTTPADEDEIDYSQPDWETNFRAAPSPGPVSFGGDKLIGAGQPEQGFDEHSPSHLVKFASDNTMTADWREETPMWGETKEESLTNICEGQETDSLWCRLWLKRHGVPARPQPAPMDQERQEVQVSSAHASDSASSEGFDSAASEGSDSDASEGDAESARVARNREAEERARLDMERRRAKAEDKAEAEQEQQLEQEAEHEDASTQETDADKKAERDIERVAEQEARAEDASDSHAEQEADAEDASSSHAEQEADAEDASSSHKAHEQESGMRTTGMSQAGVARGLDATRDQLREANDAIAEQMPPTPRPRSGETREVDDVATPEADPEFPSVGGVQRGGMETHKQGLEGIDRVKQGGKQTGDLTLEGFDRARSLSPEGMSPSADEVEERAHESGNTYQDVAEEGPPGMLPERQDTKKSNFATFEDDFVNDNQDEISERPFVDEDEES